jgi:hypothetical protein
MKRYKGKILRGRLGENSLAERDEQLLLSKQSLDDYSWAELKFIANSLSTEETKSQYYAHMLDLMKAGGTKTFEASDSITRDGKISVRIIGLCQDVKEDGTMTGLTFQTTHALSTAHSMNTSNANDGGWGKTNMRTWLNSTVYDALPDELRENIVGVKKYYGSTYDSTSGSTTFAIDKLFLLSMQELYGYTNNDYPWYEYEGTGPGHNEQYSYYSYKSVTTDNCSFLANMHKDYNGNTPGSYTSWWLRSACFLDGFTFWCVWSDASATFGSARDPFSVVPCFSL